jgi:type VI secretion system protein ImpL
LPLLDKLRGMQIVRSDFIDSLLASGVKAEADTRNRLLHATAFDRALVLASSDGAVTLSPAMDASRRLLNDLFAQPFMRSVPAAGASAAPASGMRINWDVQTLRQAEDLAESYLAFAPKEDATLPQSIQQQVRSVAGTEAAAQIGLLLGLAARPAGDLPNGGARAMPQEVSGLASALPILVNLRNTLRQAGAAAPAAALDRQVSEQAVRLLRQVDNNLASAAPYRLTDPSLSFWHGSPPLAEPAFGTSSPTDLASTLPPRRDFVETLAREYAAPLVGYLRDPGTSGNAAASGLVARWQSILDTLDRYHRSDPSNSLTRLEQFITVDMDKIDLSNCRQLNAGGGMAGDYFAEQLQNIRRAVASRCGTVVQVGTVDRYTSLSTTFNAQLAGRFPFAPVASPYAAGTGPGLGAADPNEVRRFLLEYGPDLPTLQTQFQSGGSHGQAGRAAEMFLTQLLAVQTAFAPMLADPSGSTPLAYQVDIEFFTNPAEARGQNQIIDAVVSAGNQRGSSMSGTSRIVWTNGQPARVELRWATNAPMVPDASVHQTWPRINGLSAGFDFSGSWALLRLLRAQAPSSADLNALQDRRPEVLAFEVPLKRNTNAAIGGDSEVDTAKVYLRLALTGILQAPGQPEKTVPTALPEFPTAAPLLGRTTSYLGRGTSAAPIPTTPSP